MRKAHLRLLSAGRSRDLTDKNQFHLNREFVVTTWNHAKREEPPGIHSLGEEEGVLREKFAFNLSRSYEWARTLRWKLQRKLESTPGQNQAHPPEQFDAPPPETPLGALLQQLHVGLHPVWFNHNALYHALEGAALAGLFLALRDARLGVP